MWGWLRELREILSEPPICQSCEVLRVELNAVRREKEILLDRILNPDAGQFPSAVAPAPIGMPSRHVPWRVKQQELEAQDRAKHEQIMAEFRARTAAVEKTIGVGNGEV